MTRYDKIKYDDMKYDNKMMRLEVLPLCPGIFPFQGGTVRSRKTSLEAVSGQRNRLRGKKVCVRVRKKEMDEEKGRVCVK